MSDKDWAVLAAHRPDPGKCAFDLGRALASVVAVRSEIPDDAFTAHILGTGREGHGVLIGDDGLVLTIGYLVVEAQTIWLAAEGGQVVAGHAAGYDQDTGFGLVQALGRLSVPPLRLGDSGAARVGDQVIIAGHGGLKRALSARVVARHEFAGYWEYLLEDALFTAPAHPSWGGAALIDADGALLGIGSLRLEGAHAGGHTEDINMFVPIDALKPILADLRQLGRTRTPPRPWLGMYTVENLDRLVVAGLSTGGPAHKAGVEVGDVVAEVNGEPVRELSAMYRQIWAAGASGAAVRLNLRREGAAIPITVKSASRYDFLKAPSVH
ncbi:MAG: S1C family serine protease [Pseudomonadota bacterium]